MWYHTLRAEPPADQGLMIGGTIAATPGLVALGGSFLMNSGRLLRPRRGRIDLLDDRMVIHDRWMLRRPMVINRADISRVDPLPFKPAAWSLPSRSELALRLMPTSVLLDYGTQPNIAIHFRQHRSFSEAVRTPLPRVGFAPISRGRPASALLVRVTKPDEDFSVIDDWIVNTWSTTHSGTAAGCLASCASVLVVVLWTVVTIVGIIVYAVGAGERRPDLGPPTSIDFSILGDA